MKVLRVSLADIEGQPHGSHHANTNVTVTARYTGPVTLADGRIVPAVIKAKQLSTGATGYVDFEVYASDDSLVHADWRGFAIVVTATITHARSGKQLGQVARTVKVLSSRSSPVALGSLPPAEGLPHEWVSVEEMTAALQQAAEKGANRTALWPLTRALSAGSARIVWMGDSKSEGTNLGSIANRAMDLTRDRLRARYNLTADTGKGYLPACYRVVAPDLAEEPTRTGNAVEVGHVTGVGNRCLQMMPGSTVTWPSLTWSASTPVVVHYTQHTAATASFEILVDGTVAKTVNAAGGSIASKTTTVPVSAGAHVISIHVPTGQSAGVFMEGITHRTASTGVAVFDAAVSGGMIRNFTTLPPSATNLASHWSTVAAWQPHLIVAAFGTNELFKGVTPEVWHDTIKALVAKRDEYAPGAGLLLIHAAQLASDASTARIDAYEAQARRALASSPRASIIYESDLWKPRPGFNYSSGYGVDPDGWLSDSVHLTAASASAISGRVISAIGEVLPASRATGFQSFATSARPAPAAAGVGGTYYDTTLGKPGWSDGTAWRDAAGTVI